jgi:hypothetical protein
MRLSSLSLAAVLIFSALAFAQHSSGGGGSSGGSGGGGSHGSSGGSSSSGNSASSHSSGGSASHGSSASHGASGHNSSSASSHSSAHLSHSNSSHSIREPHAEARAKFGTSVKRNFFSLLRRPFRKPEPKPEPKPELAANLRQRICFKGPCPVCPAGQVHAGGGCVGILVTNNRNFCSHREIWNGGACLLQTPFLGDCVGLRTVLERQAQRMQAAEAARQSACSTGSGQQCSDLTGTAQSEGSLYRSWQDRYNRCQQRSLRAYPY